MKKQISMLFAAIFSCAAAFGQKVNANKIPAKIKMAFENKYPNAKDANWEQEDATEYEVEFDLNEKEYSATFDSSGKWLETEFELKFEELPEAVKSAVLRVKKDFKIVECEQVENATGKIQYEVELKKGKQVRLVVFDSSGNTISGEVENK